MFAGLDCDRGLFDLQDQLGRAQVVTADLMAKVAAAIPIATAGGTTRAARINRLIELEAWTEAALALVELELPRWKVRRLVYEEGAWLCSLSKQWNLPAWLSDNVEVRHESLPLAILIAVIEARRCAEPSPSPLASSVPHCGREVSAPAEIMCCDNFA